MPSGNSLPAAASKQQTIAAQANQSAGSPDRVVLIVLVGSSIQTAGGVDRPQRTSASIRVLEGWL